MTNYKKITDLDTASSITNDDLFIVETLAGTKNVKIQTFISQVTPTKESIGLGNVDNTSDLNKPVSTAQQTALNAKLDVNTASGTYLSKTEASTTYLTQNNASGTYLSKADALTNYATKSELTTGLSGKQDTLPSQSSQAGKFLKTDGTNLSWGTVDLSSKQDTLVSGTNIKTINGNSVLGSGNLDTLPTQTGHNGQFLKSDGASASWATVDALPSQATHAGKFLTTDGSSASWATVTVPTKISDLTDDTATNPIDKADTLTDLTATVTELNYVDGVTSAIQTQLDAKQTTANLVTTITSSSTDAQYPSAKCVYDLIGNLETVLSQI